jgi:hypothetical protein
MTIPGSQIVAMFHADGSPSTKAEKTVETTNQRRYGSIYLQKVDELGNMVDGATYALMRDVLGDNVYDADGKLVSGGADDVLFEARVTGKELVESGPNAGQFAGEGWLQWNEVPWGQYYVKETQSAHGYELSEQLLPVTVNRFKVMSVQIVDALDLRKKGMVTLQKVSEANPDLVLQGAVFTLYRNDGSIFADDLVTDANGLLTVTELPWGSYYFMEKTAPTSYGVSAEKKRFSVNVLTGGSMHTLKMKDPATSYELKVTKKIRPEDVLFAHGAPSFVFNTTNGSDVNEHRVLNFDPETVAAALANGDAFVEASVLFAGLPAGTYTVSEGKTGRYVLADLAPGSDPLQDVTLQGNTALVVLGDLSPSGEVVFRNEKTVQEQDSHANVNVNVIKKERVITGIVAIWKGPEEITSEYLNHATPFNAKPIITCKKNQSDCD